MKTMRTLAVLAMAANLSLFGGGISALGRQISAGTGDILAFVREISAFAEEVLLRTGIRIPEYTPSPCVESAAALDNPYIGWYQIHAYTLSDAPWDPTDVLEQDYGPGLVLLQFNLCNFAEGPVSEAGLAQLEGILDAWHSRGRQLILRFLYDWDGKPHETEPESLSQILEHMSQTARVIDRHRDCVYILQGIYAGSWGEMHGSEYTNAEDMLTLMEHLDSVTDPSVFLAVRTPAQWRAVKDAWQAREGDSAGTGLQRLGLYNDGLLGSETDLGTYGQGDSDFSAGQTQKRSRQDEITFQNTLCNHVPNGGEVTIDNPYNDFPSAVQDLAAIHISYLNDRYDEAVLAKWQADSFTGDGPFRGMSGYDYIAAHLGYRYVLRSSALSAPASPEEAAVLTLALENVGFAPCYRPFDVALNMEAESGDYALPVEADTRLWIPGQEILLEIPLDLSALAPGEYSLSLSVSDPLSGFEIRLANEGALEGEGCPVGSLTVRISPQ